MRVARVRINTQHLISQLAAVSKVGRHHLSANPLMNCPSKADMADRAG